jgi:hypothetical protein
MAWLCLEWTGSTKNGLTTGKCYWVYGWNADKPIVIDDNGHPNGSGAVSNWKVAKAQYPGA